MVDPNETVCYCAGVARASIVDAIADGAKTLTDIQQMTGAGIGSRCKELNPKGACCHSDIRAILQVESGPQDEPSCGCSCGCGEPGSTC
ncbi:MAG: NAD(P)H-nitrite reductase [Actinobacteria bacterium HGW-Actinobacteria-6]|jgi:bacterioferritin-associated ferredoxin|nr:MAG: NAD(P)H-nitrite reductase [Actinobacteria bacterium HGW-Actinobacteria-6]